MVFYAAIEGGGTTWVAAIAENEPSNIIAKEVFKTESSPQETLARIKDWLSQYTIDAFGVATFGPVQANISKPKFGFITSSPKPGWKDTDVLQLLGLKDKWSHIPFAFDTDVNAPAVSEYVIRKKDKPTLSSTAYITVGTGVGVGLVINGLPVYGLMHPEGGHILVQPHPLDIQHGYIGTCPFHGSCIEGLCGTGALIKRKGCTIDDLPSLSDEDPLWDICAYYLAQLCLNLIMTTSVEHIALGGGVMNRTILYTLIHKHVIKLLNNYIEHDSLTAENIHTYITEPIWGSQAGLIGAAYIAHQAYHHSKHNI